MDKYNRKALGYYTLKACPQCLDDKAMRANRKEQYYECLSCGRRWKDENLKVGMRVTFVGIARSTWHEDKEAVR
jgi:Zn ribbon nucleic-acid-binding protein